MCLEEICYGDDFVDFNVSISKYKWWNYPKKMFPSNKKNLKLIQKMI